MTLTPEALEEIKARAEAATPGLWMPGHYPRDNHPCECKYVLSEGYFGAICTVHMSETRAIEEGDNPPPIEAKANILFIAHARQDIPALIQALEERDAEIERLREALWEILVFDNQFVAPIDTEAASHYAAIAEKMVALARAAMDGGA